MSAREERNRAISELRTPANYWDDHCRRCGWTFRVDEQGCNAEVCYFVGDLPKRADDPLDWHADANWPTLLRELPLAKLSRRIKTHRIKDGKIELDYFYNVKWIGNPELRCCSEVYEDLDADAVCEAWLRWKSQ